MSRKYSEESALEVLANLGGIPLEPYPGNMAAKWKCQCTSCGQIVYPRMVSLARGSRACRHCYGSNPIDPGEAERAMIAAGVQPLEPYPGYDNPWKVRCSRCGCESAPAYGSIKKASSSHACRHCPGPNQVAPGEAERAMIAAGVQPLEPYPGYNKPWKARCSRCGHESSPTYGNIKKGQGSCFRCGTDYGEAPAHVYLVHDPKRGVIKIGITNEHAHRMRSYVRWHVVECFPVPTGRLASAIEAEVLRKWRIDLGLQPKLKRNEMPYKGYTETADEIGLDAALSILNKHKCAHTDD